MRNISRHFRYSAAAATLALIAGCSATPPRTSELALPDSARISAAASPERAHATAGDSASSELWSYRLTDGWLSDLEGYDPDDPKADDREYEVENRAECQGQAEVRRCAGEDCWSWKPQGVRCSGKGNAKFVDWLHEEADSAAVCKRDGEWTVATSIPGRGGCAPEVTTDARGEPVRITLSCGWACRDPNFNCRGGARYELIRSAAIR